MLVIVIILIVIIVITAQGRPAAEGAHVDARAQRCPAATKRKAAESCSCSYLTLKMVRAGVQGQDRRARRRAHSSSLGFLLHRAPVHCSIASVVKGGARCRKRAGAGWARTSTCAPRFALLLQSTKILFFSSVPVHAAFALR